METTMFGSIGTSELFILGLLALGLYISVRRRTAVPTVAPRRASAIGASPINAGASTVRCPFCAEEIQSAAILCKHCGANLAAGVPRGQVPAATWSPGVAAVLSLVIPGAGQMYKGHVFGGLVWLFVVVVGYWMLIVPGFILHLCCIISAASGQRG